MAEYIHLFQTEAEFTSAFTNDYKEPWVGYTEATSAVSYNKKAEPIPEGAVDLGLPSGTLWATCNVGASSPEDYGNYYAWGELSGKSNYSWSTYTFGPEYPFSKYDPDDETVLELEDDVAHAIMGGNWHMPTEAQLQELTANTTSAWTSNYNGTGVAGAVFTSTANTNTNSIFIPAAGYYDDTSKSNVGSSCYLWSAELAPGYFDGAISLGLRSNGNSMTGFDRRDGFSVRGVIG